MRDDEQCGCCGAPMPGSGDPCWTCGTSDTWTNGRCDFHHDLSEQGTNEVKGE